jgi:hypothetical protein
LTELAPPDTRRGMGRPPLKPNVSTVKTTLRFPKDLLDRIEAVAGENRTAVFIREAVEDLLKRREKTAKPK